MSLPFFAMNAARASGIALLLGMVGPAPVLAASTGSVAPAPADAEAAAPAAGPAATPATGTDAGPAAAGGETFTVPEVPVATKQALNRLRHLETLLRTEPEETRIEQAMPPVALYLTHLQSQSPATRPEYLAPRELVDAEMRWRRHEAEVDAWQHALERRTRELDAAAAELRAMRAAWERTRTALATAAAPPALLDQIDALLGAVGATQEALAGRFDRTVMLQGKVGDLVDLIDGVVARIEDVRHEQDRRLYRAEAPSLITAFGDARASEALGDQVRRTWTALRAAGGQFLQSYARRLPWHAVVFVLLGVVLSALGRAARALERDEREMSSALAAARHILDRPISAAFILALLLTRLFYPLAPPPVLHALWAVALWPILRVLPRIVSPEMRAPLYGFAVLVALRELSLAAAEGTLLQRLLLLVVSLFGVAVAALVATGGGRGAARRGGAIWHTILLGTRLAVVVLLGAVVANLSGRVWLADRMAGATIVSAYAGILLFAALMVLDGMAVIGLRQAAARTLASVRNNDAFLRRRVRRVLDVAAVTWWVSVTLEAFSVREPVMNALASVAAASLEVGSLKVSLGDLLTFAAAILIAFLLSRFARFVLDEDILPALSIEPGVRPMVLTLVHYILVGLGVIFGIAAAGFPVDRLTLLISALGVGIGFGLQNLVNNFVSGLSLIFERPIRIGDQVQVGTLLGRVERIGLRATVLRTVQGSEVIVPNADLIAKEVTNWTFSDRLRRVEITVGVAYGTDPERVLDLLVAAARGHADVLPEPAPIALFQRFGESSLDFALRFWAVGDDRFFVVESEVRMAVWRALGAAGIAIPFPQRDLHVSVDPAALDVLSGPATRDVLSGPAARDVIPGKVASDD
ncbi:MAG TPA: mechanosensitive ion channel domain-containing protein [Candidatus Cryosericum sp.]|nr:mechanosensitive ion channel domain-containing protein [Candidatus Cryosericum sp.]